MTKMNWHDRILAYMQYYGYKEVATRSTKYRRFVMSGNVSSEENVRSYLLGRNGNVRREYVDEHGKVLQSMSVTEMFKKYTIIWEQSLQGKG